MSYSTTVTAVTGGTLTAAQWNTGVRDNFTAIWVYTTAGDIAYATSATAAARLGIGAAGSFLSSTGSAPQWKTDGLIHTKGTDGFNASDQSRTLTSYADVTGATLDLTTTQTCTILMICSVQLAVASAGQGARVRGMIGGTADSRTMPYVSHTSYSIASYNYYRTGVTAGTITCKLQFSTTGGTAYVNIGTIEAFAFTE